MFIDLNITNMQFFIEEKYGHQYDHYQLFYQQQFISLT